jgi:ribosomal protein S18 acetylase RimI-like enzyme
MEESRYFIRPFAGTDQEVQSRVWTRVQPEQPVTVEEIRHYEKMFEDRRYFKHDLVAVERAAGEGVAVASIYHTPWTYDPNRYWTEVAVDPAHQCQGVGRELFHRLEAVARSRQAQGLWGSVRSDQPRSVRFFERAGFVERRRTWISRLDLEAVPPATTSRNRDRWAAERVEFTTLAEAGPDRPEVRERLYRLDTVTSRDVPRMAPATDLSFEQYVQLAFGGPGFLPEGIFLAQVGNEYVAETTLLRIPSEPDSLHVGFTGTLPSFRGRGLATELKRQAVEFARARGYRYLRTANDSTNRRIWAINEKLGFRPQWTWIQGEKELSTGR